MRIAIIVEGKTEKVFIPVLRNFLVGRLSGRMPNLDAFPRAGRIPKNDKLRRVVFNLLEDGAEECPELKAFVNTILQLCGGDVL